MLYETKRVRTLFVGTKWGWDQVPGILISEGEIHIYDFCNL